MQATTALHDCGYDEEKAIHSLLEGDGGDDEWTSVKTKQKKQAFGIAAGSLSATGSANSFGRPAERGVSSRGKPGKYKTIYFSPLFTGLSLCFFADMGKKNDAWFACVKM